MRIRTITPLGRIFLWVVYVGVALFLLNIIGIPRLLKQITADPTRLSLFTHTVDSFCWGNFEGYVHKFAHLKNVIIDPSKADGRPGGEELSSVLNQPEYVEYFEFTPGYFVISCSQVPNYRFRDDHHLNLWMEVLKVSPDIGINDFIKKGGNSLHKKFTIAVTRYEYANLYHQIADFYNAFIILRVFNLNPDETDILIVDGHPKCGIDSIWNVLFGDVIRAGHLKEPLFFENLVWGIQGYTSSLHQHTRDKIPEIPAFADFVLQRFNVVETKRPDCTDLSVLFVWRRNYVSHPRNPSGVVARKIVNEEELITFVKDSLTIGGRLMGNVKGVHLESLEFKEQLKLIRQTDILIGMHGAGLSHILFLPSHGGLIEIFPSPKMAVNRHFKAMATWRNLHYLSYINRYQPIDAQNDDVALESSDIAELVKDMKDKICVNV